MIYPTRGYEWWNAHLTTEIYLNTHRGDWWSVCDVLAHLMRSATSVLDVGGGDGHTLWQIISVTRGIGATLAEVTLVEPDTAALQRAYDRLSQFSIKRLEACAGTIEVCGPQMLAKRKVPFDVVFVSHTNYYFGRNTGGKCDSTLYRNTLDLLLTLGKRVIILTASEESDYYKVVSKNPFSNEVSSESTGRYYRERGCTVEVIPTPMRFYVAHAHKSREEAVLLWQFFHDTMRTPSEEELADCRRRLQIVTDESDHMNFKDDVLVVTEPST